MGMDNSMILIANPGSASRKYALYEDEQCRAQVHFEYAAGTVACTFKKDKKLTSVQTGIADITQSASQVLDIFKAHGVLDAREHIQFVGLRIVAPSSYFLEDRLIDEAVLSRLEALLPCAPLHIEATLQELRLLRQHFPDTPIFGLSDSAFHITKPDYAWNYGLPLHDADRLDIKRFGYHGLSVAAVVETLKKADKLPPKLVVCHLGSGASVSAVHGGKSVDTTMGYSPLEGAIMATRSGSIDPTAVQALKQGLSMDDKAIDAYLNKQSGLQGLAGSSDLRELLEREAAGDHYAHLAIRTYIFAVQKAIGQMTAALGGVDVLALTGTVGERSAPIRKRIMERLHYLDLLLDEHANTASESMQAITTISRLAHSKPVYVIPTNESDEMVRRLLRIVAR